MTETNRNLTKFSCGRKVGQRLSDANLIWSEYWFEANMCDFGLETDPDSKREVKNVVVKHQSKFWTNQASRLLEGESCLQLLNDGSKHFSHDGLLFEMKEFFSCDDISHNTPDNLFVKDYKPAQINLDIIDFHGRRKDPKV